MSVPPAPTLISNGFTDDLFPADEAVRYANKVFSKYPRARIAQLHFDYGHPRGQGKADGEALLSRRTHNWFDRYVKGEARQGPTRGRGADPDLPERRAVGRPLPARRPGTRSAPARCATRRPARRPSVLLGEPGGVTRDRPDLGPGRLRCPAGCGRGRHGHVPAAGRHRQGLHAARLAGRERALRGDRPAPGVGHAALGRGARRRDPDARGARPLPPAQGQPPGLPAPPERLALQGRPRAEARVRRPRQPLRPAVELRLVDRGLGPAAAPAGARGGRAGRSRSPRSARSIARRPRRRRPAKVRSPSSRCCRPSRAGSGGSARRRTPSAAPS